MNYWRQFPLLRLVCPVVAGITAGFLPELPSPVPGWIPAIVFVPVFVLCLQAIRLLPYRFRWIPGLSVWVLLFLLFLGITLDRRFQMQNDPIALPGRIPGLFLAELTEPPQEKKSTFKSVLQLMACYQNGRWSRTNGKCLVYFRKSSEAAQLQYGHWIIFYARLAEPALSANPGSFDYRKYLIRKGIGCSAFPDSADWLTVKCRHGNPLLRLALRTRDHLLGILRQNRVEGGEFAVAAALLLGYVNEIDTETYRDYGATGAMHILSVSGMHVGIIFVVLEFLFSFLEKRRWGILARSLLIILLIWGYAFITGLSPAVLRASVMLSLIVTGKTLKRHPDLFNILAASGITLLCADPLLLTDTGFQLSYLAVGGILLFYQPLCSLLLTGRHLADKGVALVAVSFSAQLATFPLGLWYFHQFPNYFLLTNLLVVPLSSIIIYTGIALLVISPISGVARLLASILTILLKLLNGSIHVIGTLPGAVTGGIYLSVPELLLIYLVILTGFLFFSLKRKRWLFLALVLTLILELDFLVLRMECLANRRFIVYQHKSGILMDFFGRGEGILTGDLELLRDPRTTAFVAASRASSSIREKYCILLPAQPKRNPFSTGSGFAMNGSVFCLGDRRTVLIRKGVPDGAVGVITADYLVITGNPELNLNLVLQHFPGALLIVDATNAGWRVQRWKSEAAKLGIPFYCIRDGGAFVADF